VLKPYYSAVDAAVVAVGSDFGCNFLEELVLIVLLLLGVGDVGGQFVGKQLFLAVFSCF
jgi:hypothetical protein